MGRDELLFAERTDLLVATLETEPTRTVGVRLADLAAQAVSHHRGIDEEFAHVNVRALLDPEEQEVQVILQGETHRGESNRARAWIR
jgi:hypothetical protein